MNGYDRIVQSLLGDLGGYAPEPTQGQFGDVNLYGSQANSGLLNDDAYQRAASGAETPYSSDPYTGQQGPYVPVNDYGYDYGQQEVPPPTFSQGPPSGYADNAMGSMPNYRDMSQGQSLQGLMSMASFQQPQRQWSPVTSAFQAAGGLLGRRQ